MPWTRRILPRCWCSRLPLMGNCVWRSFAEDEEAIKVMTLSGGVMEFDGPLTAECITNEYPGHGLFHQGSIPRPLANNEELVNGELYHLLPLDHQKRETSDQESPVDPSDVVLPRISTHTISAISKCKKPTMELLPAQRNGVWRVKLVISQEQLTEILSEESNTEALIESVRTVAKCGSIGAGGSDLQDQLKFSNHAWKPSVDSIPEVVVVDDQSGLKMDRGI